MQYYEGMIDNCQNDQKLMWKTLKSLISKKGDAVAIAIDFEENLTECKQDIASKFNRFYIDSVMNIAENIDVSLSNWEILECNNANTGSLSDFKLLNIEELKKIVYNVKSKSSPDEICVEFIKQCFAIIGGPLLHLINSSLLEGVVPSHLKISTIIPIQKVKNTIKCEEFRPINMLPALEKIVELAVYKQVNDYLQDNQFIIKEQSGFRCGHNCETAIQLVISNWKNSLDKGEIIIAVFLDLRRAFETVNRSKLIKKTTGL